MQLIDVIIDSTDGVQREPKTKISFSGGINVVASTHHPFPHLVSQFLSEASGCVSAILQSAGQVEGIGPRMESSSWLTPSLRWNII